VREVRKMPEEGYDIIKLGLYGHINSRRIIPSRMIVNHSDGAQSKPQVESRAF
jgi:hypothetical protein